jgi:lysozyme family protein
MDNLELCKEKHKQIDDKLESHSDSIKNHYERIGKLEVAQSKQIERIDNVCDKVSGLTKAIWWFIGIIVSSYIAFFFSTIQNLVNKGG